MNETLKVLQTRRSVRAYQAEQISQETLDEILKAGLYAPSARNTQNRQFTVVQGEEKLEALRGVMAQALKREDYGRFYGAPTLIIVSAPRDYEHAAPDCAVALENMFLAAKALGLGSVWINQLCGPTADVPAVRELLAKFSVPGSHLVYGCAAIGKPDGEVPEDRENKGAVVFA